jgi:hypothetical protein
VDDEDERDDERRRSTSRERARRGSVVASKRARRRRLFYDAAMSRIARRGVPLLLGLGLLGEAAPALAQHQPLPATLLALDSPEG